MRRQAVAVAMARMSGAVHPDIAEQCSFDSRNGVAGSAGPPVRGSYDPKDHRRSRFRRPGRGCGEVLRFLTKVALDATEIRGTVFKK